MKFKDLVQVILSAKSLFALQSIKLTDVQSAVKDLEARLEALEKK